MLTLALETATLTSGLALAEDGRLLYERTAGRLRGHGGRLFPMAQALLADAGVAPADLGCIAVSAGPGSFTAVRIGVAAAKALAMAVPGAVIVSVDTLEAMSLAVFAPGRVVVPLLDARRGEVYGAAFRVVSEGRPERLCEDLCGRIEEVIAAASSGGDAPVVFGSGARVYADRLARVVGSAVFAPAVLDMPRAAHVAYLAPLVLAEEGETPRGELHPRYLRNPDVRKPSGGGAGWGAEGGAEGEDAGEAGAGGSGGGGEGGA